MSTQTQTADATQMTSWSDRFSLPQTDPPHARDALRALGNRLIAEWEAAVAPGYALPRPYLTAEMERYRHELHRLVDELEEEARRATMLKGAHDVLREADL